MARYTPVGTLDDFDERTIPENWIEYSFSSDSASGHGCVWEIQEREKIYHTISSNTSGGDDLLSLDLDTYGDMKLTKHHVLSDEGWEEVCGILVVQRLTKKNG